MDPIQIAIANRRKLATKKPIVPPRKPPVYTPPAPPNFAALLAELSRGPVDRTDQEWASLLDPRVKPYTDAIEGSTLRGRAFNEYNLETKAAANQGLSSAFLSILTGGKPGDEGMAYSKENFGGSYLGGQAMSLAASELSRLTTDFDETDWKITSQYLEAMQEIPQIREELRLTIEKQDMDDHTRKVTEATLLMDETWRYWQENRKNFESDRDFREGQRLDNEKMKVARQALGVDKTKATTGRINAKTSQTNAAISAARAQVSAAGEARRIAKDKVSKQQAEREYKLSVERLKLEQQKFRQQQKDTKTGGGKVSDAKKAETDLAIDILKGRDTIIGKPEYGDEPVSAANPRVGGMTYQEAYRYIRGFAEETMKTRGSAYINTWVRRQLARLGLKDPTARPRQGN